MEILFQRQPLRNNEVELHIIDFFTLMLSGISMETRNIVVREASTTENRPAVRTTVSDTARHMFVIINVDVGPCILKVRVTE